MSVIYFLEIVCLCNNESLIVISESQIVRFLHRCRVDVCVRWSRFFPCIELMFRIKLIFVSKMSVDWWNMSTVFHEMSHILLPFLICTVWSVLIGCAVIAFLVLWEGRRTCPACLPCLCVAEVRICLFRPRVSILFHEKLKDSYPWAGFLLPSEVTLGYLGPVTIPHLQLLSAVCQ